jgi:hypothetical protein
MPKPHNGPSRPAFPRSQRELVGLALQRGCRPRDVPAAPRSQRDRVRLAVQLGLGGGPKTSGDSQPRPGIHR